MTEMTLSQQIASRLQTYTADPDHDALNLRQRAVEFEALPLCVDWEQCWALKVDGRVVVFAHGDGDANLREESDARMINVALYQGSLTYPELKALVPARSGDADDCPYCVEKGIDPTSLEQQQIICYCGGLGWIPRAD